MTPLALHTASPLRVHQIGSCSAMEPVRRGSKTSTRSKDGEPEGTLRPHKVRPVVALLQATTAWPASGKDRSGMIR